ncbi:MAG: maleylacetoacetate isomerase [Pseudomonadota bacterium]
MTEITLYDYWRSSAAYRLRIAFNLAKLPFDSVSVDLVAGEHRGDENAARNPQRLVPTAVVDGQVLTQSLAVIEYLYDTGHYFFLPQDILGKHRVRALSYAIAMEIHPVCNLSVAKFASENSGGNISMKSWMQHFIPKGFEGVEMMLHDADTFCHGNNLTMADCCLMPQMYNALRWEVDMTPFPKIMAKYTALKDVPEIAAAHPDRFQPE